MPAGSPFGLRPAAVDDLPAIQRIYAHHVIHGLGSFEEIPPDLMEMQARYAALMERRFPYLVAESAGEILGYAYAAPYRPRPAYRYSLEDSVYVAPQAQGQGCGRALLARLIEESTALGYRQMIAVIGGDSANLPSIALHRALGFQERGVLQNVGFKLGRWVAVAILQRPLGAGSTIPP